MLCVKLWSVSLACCVFGLTHGWLVNIGWYSEEAGHAHVIATIH